MNDEYNKGNVLVYKKDLEKEEVKYCLDTIREKNDALGMFLVQNLKADDSQGIRMDVLKFFSENIEQINPDPNFIFNIAILTKNVHLNSEWYGWINSYSKGSRSFPMDDFMTLLYEALNKKIPLQKLKKMFDEDTEGFLNVFQAIESYSEGMWLDEEETEEIRLDSSFYASEDNEDFTDLSNEKEADMASIFGSLLTVVSDRRCEDNALIPVQKHLSGYAVSLQNFVNDITTYSGKIVNEWQKDRDENERLKSLNRLQQKLMEGQQRKMEDMRTEIIRLNAKLQEAEKSEMHRAAISRKISELQSLSLNDSFHNPGY